MPRVKKVYMSNKIVYPDLSYTPTEHTVLYLPLKRDVKDYSNNDWYISYTGTKDFQNPGLRCSSDVIDTGYRTNYNNFTILGRLKCPSNSTEAALFQKQRAWSSGYYGWDLIANCDSRSSVMRVEVLAATTSIKVKNYYSVDTTKWHNYCFKIENNNTGYFYIDGVQIASFNISGRRWYDGPLTIWAPNSTVSEIILEDRARTNSEISTYYNNTKSQFGIS